MHSVECVIRAKSILDTMPICYSNNEFINIQTMMANYIKKHCKHSIIKDSIDIHPDKSKTIFYCEYCLTTFDRP